MKYPEPESERFTVQYIITINDKRSIEEHASDITLEQTVEVPEDCVPEKHFEDGIIGIVEKHQLRNEGKVPFGFFCIVDHRRDKPAVMK
jgi:hypothetical protein